VSDYNDLVRQDRRREVLRFLAECAQYTSNADILLTVVNRLGFPTTRDALVGDLVWLREQGFADLDDQEAFVVVTATERGVEIAKGLARHPGVSRPRPRA
jgi:hypothetical protein